MQITFAMLMKRPYYQWKNRYITKLNVLYTNGKYSKHNDLQKPSTNAKQLNVVCLFKKNSSVTWDGF